MGPEIIIPVVIFAIPIVAILTSHQRNMSELIHNRHTQQQASVPNAEIQALRREVAELRELVLQQTIQMDGYQDPSPARENLAAPPNDQHIQA
jgi:hypothetical protein